MRELELDEIRELAKRPNVRAIAVENFLMSFHPDVGPVGNHYNLIMDSRSYGWNEATVKACSDGLRLAERPRGWSVVD